MRRRNRQGRIRTAEDLFFKIVVSLVLAMVVAGALALALRDDSKPMPSPTHTAATEEKAPRRVPTVGITAPPPATTTTTTTKPAGLTPADILAFTAAVDQAKASTAAAFARLLALSGGGAAKPAASTPPAPGVSGPPSPSTTAPPTTPTAATTTSTTTVVPVTTTTTVPTTTTTRPRGKP
jgi:hypothetical protein